MEKSRVAIVVVSLSLLLAGCPAFGGGGSDAGAPAVPATETDQTNGAATDTTPTESATDESPSTDDSPSTDTHVASPTETTTPTEPATETDTSADPDTDTPTEEDADTETPSDHTTETDTSTAREPPSDPETDTPTDPGTDTPTDPETDTPTDPDPETDTPTEPEPSPSIEPVNPAEFAIEPGTTVMFEFESDDSYSTHWYVDDEYVGDSLNPHAATYYAHSDRVYRPITLDETGTRNVSARVQTGDDSIETVNWTVDVAEAAGSPPTVEELSPDPNSSIEYVWNENISLGVTAADEDGDLDRVIWWEEQRDIIPAIDAISGERASTNVSMVCDHCTPEAWVLDENGAITYAGWGDLDIADVLSVEIVETNEPVVRGQVLEVTAAVENTGSEPHRQEYELEITDSGGEVVDRANVSVDPRSTERFTLTYETTVETPDNLTLGVSSTHGNQEDEVTVSVRDEE